MRALNPREKRFVFLGAACVALYALWFGGVRVWKALALQRSNYVQLVREADTLGLEIKAYQAKADSVQKMMEDFKLDPAKLNKSTAVAEASAAIQKLAQSSGVQFAAVRESPGRAANKELATMQFEGMGQVPAVTALLNRLESVGYPVIIETIQLNPIPNQPMMKFNMTLVILDFEQWKKGGVPNA